jgi:RimJ/RimL family protein N-acetyltransferase
MKTANIIKTFIAKNDRRVLLRTVVMDDLDDLLELINSLVEEKADIFVTKRFTGEEEAEWLSRVLLQVEKNEVFFLVAEVDGNIVASSDVQIRGEDEKEGGLIGIIIRNDYRNLGIGTEIMKTMVEKSSSLGLKVLIVNVFATNNRAIHLYEKIGFVPTKIIPRKHFRQNRFIDEIIMKKKIN